VWTEFICEASKTARRRGVIWYDDCSFLKSLSARLSSRTRCTVPKVCVFSRESGPLIKQWPDDMPATFVHEGREYRRYRLSRLVSDREIDEAFVYAACAVTPADEMLIFHALYPGVGGVFTIEPASIQP
jgi:hypothetical protein